jgi:5-formyltetrahydrofolate cyclo-ligase
MNSIAAEKNQLREFMLYKRNRISIRQVYEKSKRVQYNVVNSRQFLIAQTVGVYFPLGSEVRTEEIIRVAISSGKKVALPRVKSGGMKFYQINDKAFKLDNLVIGRFGIREPIKNGEEVVKIDLLIVPGIVFDSQGSRIGYGRGYFDRFIGGAKVSFSLGLAYQFQLVSYRLPQSDVDQKIDGLSIETGILYF